MAEKFSIPMTKGTLTEAAKKMGIPKNTLFYKLKNKDVEALEVIKEIEIRKAKEEERREKKFNKIINQLSNIVD